MPGFVDFCPAPVFSHTCFICRLFHTHTHTHAVQYVATVTLKDQRGPFKSVSRHTLHVSHHLLSRQKNNKTKNKKKVLQWNFQWSWRVSLSFSFRLMRHRKTFSKIGKKRNVRPPFASLERKCQDLKRRKNKITNNIAPQTQEY